MSFLHPEFLYLMLPALLVLFALLLTQAESVSQHFSPSVLEKLRVDSDQFSLTTRHLFFALMLFFIIIALSTPVVKQGSAYVQNEKEAIYIAINRHDVRALQSELLPLLKEVDQGYFGLLLFDTKTYLLSPPSSNAQILIQMLKGAEDSNVSETSLIELMKRVTKLYAQTTLKCLVVVDNRTTVVSKESIDYALKHKIELSWLVTESRVLSASLLSLVHQSGGEILDGKKLFEYLNDTAKVDKDEKPIYFYLFIIPIALAMLMFIVATSSFHKGESHYVPLLFLLMMGLPQGVKAEIFADATLLKAKEAYRTEKYKVCATLFSAYGLKNESREAIYNSANCYYRAGAYKEAIAYYRSIHFEDNQQNADLYFNLANALVASAQKEETLLEAISVYKKVGIYREDETSLIMIQKIKRVLLHKRKKGLEMHYIKKSHQPISFKKVQKVEKPLFKVEAMLIK